MIWDLPTFVNIDGANYAIRNKCDYRVVLDVICALNDSDLNAEEKMRCALYIFYEDISSIKNLERAAREMYRIINGGEEVKIKPTKKPQVMDWEYDFKYIAPPISRVLGYDVRMPDRYCHFWTFLGAYMEIGECTFSTIVSIRSKRARGKKLEKWEMDFLREHREIIDLPQKLTAEEQDILDSEW